MEFTLSQHEYNPKFLGKHLIKFALKKDGSEWGAISVQVEIIECEVTEDLTESMDFQYSNSPPEP